MRHIRDILQTLDVVQQAQRRNRVTLTDFHRVFDAAEEESAAALVQGLDENDPVQVLVRHGGEIYEELRITYDEDLDAIVIDIGIG